MIDRFGRHITYLRVSVTDRCDFRCVYCMAEDMTFLPRKDLLSLEEIDRLASAFIARGVRKLRLTGGEPLVRRNIMWLVKSLSRHVGAGLDELTLTTNGSQLARYADELAECGVKRINVSLDTLDPGKFRVITRKGDFHQVMSGIDAASRAGLKIKINTVGAPRRERRRARRHFALGAWARLRSHSDRDHADGRGRCRPGRAISSALARPRAARAALHFRRHSLPLGRTGALCAGAGNRRQARLHHADDP
jgi:uncharacterized Fe-S cluster-containing radical SAM superfamily protein